MSSSAPILSASSVSPASPTQPPQRLVIPFAFANVFEQAWQTQRPTLPNLAQLLASLPQQQWEYADEFTPVLPHERLLCQSLGVAQANQPVPLAALHVLQHRPAACEGVPTDAAWAFITPAHMQVTTDRIVLHDPAMLQLHEEEARTIFQTLKDWCAQDDVHLVWDEPHHWLAHSPHFEGLTCASLERVLQRDARQWLPSVAQAPVLQRLQTEAQMLLYQLPLNDARMQRGLPIVNTFWVSGSGSIAQPQQPSPQALQAVQVERSLTPLALAGHWQAWLEAWQALDQTLLASWLQRHQQGQPVEIIFGGERNAVRLAAGPANSKPGLLQRMRSWLQRSPQPDDAARLLASL